MLKKIGFLLLPLFLFIICTTGCKNKNNAENSTLQSSVPDTEMITETEHLTETINETPVSSEEIQEGMTNGEFLHLIINMFEIYSEGTFESDVTEAKFWHLIDENTQVEENAVVTPEFLISVSMRATEYVDENASMEEILNCAVKYKVIEQPDISSVDITRAKEIVEAAKQAYLYPEKY